MASDVAPRTCLLLTAERDRQVLSPGPANVSLVSCVSESNGVSVGWLSLVLVTVIDVGRARTVGL